MTQSEILNRSAEISKALAGATAGTSMGKPIYQFKKKTFVFLDKDKGNIIVRTSNEELERQLNEPGYFKPPFCSKKTPWIGIELGKTNLSVVEALIQRSYDIVTTK